MYFSIGEVEGELAGNELGKITISEVSYTQLISALPL